MSVVEQFAGYTAQAIQKVQLLAGSLFSVIFRDLGPKPPTPALPPLPPAFAEAVMTMEDMAILAVQSLDGWPIVRGNGVRGPWAGTYGAVYQVAVEGREMPYAVKVFKETASRKMIQSAADLYQVASVAGIGPRMHAAMRHGQFSAIVMDCYSSDLHRTLAQPGLSPAVMQKIGLETDALLMQLAAVGWTCQDLKPGNFVVNLKPEVTVRMIDFDAEFCEAHGDMTADAITRQYLKMKALMELTTTYLMRDVPSMAPGGPGLFGREYRLSDAYIAGRDLLRDDDDMHDTARHYLQVDDGGVLPDAGIYRQAARHTQNRTRAPYTVDAAVKSLATTIEKRKLGPMLQQAVARPGATKLTRDRRASTDKYARLMMPSEQVDYKFI